MTSGLKPLPAKSAGLEMLAQLWEGDGAGCASVQEAIEAIERERCQCLGMAHDRESLVALVCVVMVGAL